MSGPTEFVTDTSWREAETLADILTEDCIWQGGPEMSNLSSRRTSLPEPVTQEQFGALAEYVRSTHLRVMSHMSDTSEANRATIRDLFKHNKRRLRETFWLTLVVLGLVGNAIIQWALL